MTMQEAIALVRRKWDVSGECASCGWHAALYEYGDLEHAIDINEAQGRVELRCLSDEAREDGGHRGVRIYFDQAGSPSEPPTQAGS